MSGTHRWKFSENHSKTSHFEIYRRNAVNTRHIATNNDTSSSNKYKAIGYIEGNFDNNDNKHLANDNRKKIIEKQAWAVAQSPGKQIFMTGLMMWMSGNTLSIITLMMIVMGMWRPITALFSVQNAFKQYETKENWKDLILPKIVYLTFNGICLGIGVWKLNSLGLLPTGSHVPPTLSAPNYTEFSSAAIIS